jgi:hypothetical protein
MLAPTKIWGNVSMRRSCADVGVPNMTWSTWRRSRPGQPMGYCSGGGWPMLYLSIRDEPYATRQARHVRSKSENADLVMMRAAAEMRIIPHG